MSNSRLPPNRPGFAGGALLGKPAAVQTGGSARFSAPFVFNSIVVWRSDAIRVIQDGSARDLSAGYRYIPDMTPGVFDGMRYDGVMRDMEGSHVARVSVGRVSGAVVMDGCRRLGP